MATFANDQDLLKWEPELTVYVPSDVQSDFMPQHLAAGEAIVDDLKKKDIIEDESQIMEPSELKQMAIFKTLSIIFNFLSVSSDDKFMSKADNYEARYENELNKALNSLTIDVNKDLIVSDSEKNQSFQPIFERQ